MLNRFKLLKLPTTTFLYAAISCFRINSILHVPTPKPIITSSTFHTSKQPTLNTVSDLHNAFDSIQNIDEATSLFHHMLQMKHPPPIRYHNMLLNIIVKMQHYSHVILLFKKLCFLGCPVEKYTMSIVINSYCHLKEVDLGFAVVANFLKRGYPPDIVCFTCLLKGLFIKGNVVGAIGLFKKLVIENLCEVNEFAITTMLDGLSKSGKVEYAIDLLRISEKKRKWKLNAYCYNVIIDGLCRSRLLKKGMEVLYRMSDRGILPDVVTYNIFLYGLCTNAKLDLAFTIFNDLGSKGIKPDVITYTVMIQGLCLEGLFHGAKEMLEKMERIGCLPNCITYNVITQGCLQLQHRHKIESINLLKQIVGRDFQFAASTFFLLLRQVQVLRQMHGIYDDDVINHLILKLIANGTTHQLKSKNDGFVMKSLIRKLSNF